MPIRPLSVAVLCALLAGSASAQDLSGLWSFGLTSIRTGEPLIEAGGQHRIDPATVRYGYNRVLDRSGNVLSPRATPLHGGEQLQVTTTYQDDANSREFARIVAIMAPIRDAILYDFEQISRQDWLDATQVLTLNGIKTQDAASLDRRAILSTGQVWDYVASSPSDGSPVMRYLEEAGLELKCLAFTDFDFTNPEGNDHCADHGLVPGTGLTLP